MKPRDATVHHDIMVCPVCRLNIVATVTVQTHLGAPTIDTDGSVSVPARPEMTRFNVHHACPGAVEADMPAPEKASA